MTSQGATRRRPRLLIADDDLVITSLLSAALVRDFDLVGIAGDSEEAIALAGASQPDVALIDVEMPKGGAPRAVPGIVEVAPEAAIVVLSGDESDTLVRDLIRAGAVAYSRKGIDPEDLVALLHNAIEVRATERARSRVPTA